MKPPTHEQLQLLRNFCDKFRVLDQQEWADFSAIWEVVSYKRKTILTAEGETEKYIYFVLEGLQRSFCLGEGEKDHTLVFTYPYSFSGVADSFLLQKPSRFYLETLTASTFLRAPHSAYLQIADKYHNFERLISIILAGVLSGVLERQIELQSYTAEQKFRTLLKRSPHVLKLIPHKYLSSYLGIDPATFSKLLGSVKL